MSLFFSQAREDEILASLFEPDHIGTIVDIGASDGKNGSNSLYFERRGWRCICVEPNPKLFEQCDKIRKCSVCCAVGETVGENIPFTIFTLKGDGNQSAISGLQPDPRLIETHAHLIERSEVIHVPVLTLTSILDADSFPTEIDICSIDVENTELSVLKGLDMNKYKVKVFVIENNFHDLEVDMYLAKFGYERFHRQAVNNFYRKRV